MTVMPLKITLIRTFFLGGCEAGLTAVFIHPCRRSEHALLWQEVVLLLAALLSGPCAQTGRSEESRTQKGASKFYCHSSLNMESVVSLLTPLSFWHCWFWVDACSWPSSCGESYMFPS